MTVLYALMYKTKTGKDMGSSWKEYEFGGSSIYGSIDNKSLPKLFTTKMKAEKFAKSLNRKTEYTVVQLQVHS